MSGTTNTDGGSLGLVETLRVVLFDEDHPLELESGERLAPVEVAYETYGSPNRDGSNAVFVCHALTGDAHAAGHHGDAERPGWWDNIIGPGRPIDTDRFYVVCPNLLGGCQGTTGPSSPDPATGKPRGLNFPIFSVGDLVTVHRALAAHLGGPRPLAVIGGSLGGMQALQWALDYPDDLGAAIIIASTAHLTAQNIAFSAVARAAILRDPEFRDGNYHEHGQPAYGLSLARMIAHITYLSEAAMREKFGRRLQGSEVPRPGFDVDFQVESYLEHQGNSFLNRFDALSYLYLTRCMDYFDPFADEAAAVRRLQATRARFLLISFDTDWRFSTAHSKEIVRVLLAAHREVSFREIPSPWGHDSFLLRIPEYHRTVQGFLAQLADGIRA
ncbi:MAG TPA: homoserine O-acetyltransferase [Miltoncostaeaceae bacterium]|nr:homoserine O-acetyltransferase [Miltoncostaeaceae bacterium]